MSSRKPRTVEHFPRMKQRGGRRRHRQRQSQILADMPRSLAAQFRALSAAVTGFVEGIRGAFAAILPPPRREETQDDYSLAAGKAHS